MCDHLDDADASVLGRFSSLEIETGEGLDGRRERLCLRFGEQAGLVTLDVGGGDGAAVEETIRGLYDALRSTSLAMKSGAVVRGGGSFHMGASLVVKEAAEGQAGRERLAMEAFARALENIPSTLAQNAGVDRLDTLLALRAAHRSGQHHAGIGADGTVTPIEGTWLPPTPSIMRLKPPPKQPVVCSGWTRSSLLGATEQVANRTLSLCSNASDGATAITGSVHVHRFFAASGASQRVRQNRYRRVRHRLGRARL